MSSVPAVPPAPVAVRLVDPLELHRILPLIQQLNPAIPLATLQARLAEMETIGYACAGAFAGDELVGVAGMWIGVRLYSGRYLDVDNVVVDTRLRGRGVGRQLMDWVHAYARARGCRVCMLDAYLSNTDGHRFYQRDGYQPLGYHFIKQLDG
jgi:GNAT superfamily N-acetyltransferase